MLRSIASACVAGLMATQAAAIIAPPTCTADDGAQYISIAKYPNDIVVAYALLPETPDQYTAVLHACTTNQQLRISTGTDLEANWAVYDALSTMAAETRSHTLQSIATGFADRGFSVAAVSGMGPPCLCNGGY